MSATSFLYRLARLSNDIRIAQTGDPKRITRRLKNKLIGRLLAKLKIWR